MSADASPSSSTAQDSFPASSVTSTSPASRAAITLRTPSRSCCSSLTLPRYTALPAGLVHWKGSSSSFARSTSAASRAARSAARLLEAELLALAMGKEVQAERKVVRACLPRRRRCDSSGEPPGAGY